MATIDRFIKDKLWYLVVHVGLVLFQVPPLVHESFFHVEQKLQAGVIVGLYYDLQQASQVRFPRTVVLQQGGIGYAILRESCG